eukprot:TRINITY_DN14245_c0_g1_i1.p1 TRINITY_DN14245_c0_g1~~TRINITY_DN14245_c0_g1_i1.p1  ORF type:complete len:410 (+),score=109.37 TRINITY_DN14245_c0_g1_i1:6-1235(+)
MLKSELIKLEELYNMGFINQVEYNQRKGSHSNIPEEYEENEENDEGDYGEEYDDRLEIYQFKQFDNNISKIDSDEFPTIEESLKIYKDLSSQENFLQLKTSIDKNQIKLDANEMKNQGASKSILDILNRYPKLVIPGSSINCSIVIDKNWEKEKFFGKQPQVPTNDIKKEWQEEQKKMSDKVELINRFDWNLIPSSPQCIKYVGGVDISFPRKNQTDACACLVIMDYKTKKIVYECYTMLKLTAPYIAGFLAFREVPAFIVLVNKLKEEAPSFLPQLILVDGNGILHPSLFGLACHLGVICDIPTLGVSKKLLYCRGITEESVKQSLEQGKLKGVDAHLNDQKTGKDIACVMIKNNQQIFISPGHRIDLPTCVSIVKSLYLKNPLPEPIHFADNYSRLFIQENYDNAFN